MLRRILTTCGPVAPPPGADGQSEHVSRGAAASRVGSARTLAGCLSIFGQSARCTAYLGPEHYGSGSENGY